MPKNPLLTSMQAWIAQCLEETGQYSLISIGHHFPTRDPLMHLEQQRHIYAIRKPEYTHDDPLTPEYLVLAGVRPFASVAAFTQKIRRLNQHGIAVCPILFSGIIEGYARDVEPKHTAALWRIPKQQRRLLIHITEEERYLHTFTNGHVVYYHPEPTPHLTTTALTDRAKADYTPQKRAGRFPNWGPVERLRTTIRNPEAHTTHTAFSLRATRMRDHTVLALPIPAVIDPQLRVENLIRQWEAAKKNRSSHAADLGERISIMTETWNDAQYAAATRRALAREGQYPLFV